MRGTRGGPGARGRTHRLGPWWIPEPSSTSSSRPGTGGRHRCLGRTGSLARFEVGRPSARDRARVLGELPWFVRNLVVKVLLRLRARPVAWLLGYDDVADPY